MPADPEGPLQGESEHLGPAGAANKAGDTISVGVEGSQTVAAGKNIIQIGSLSLPRWAALLLVAAVTLVALLVGVVAYFSYQTGESTQQAAAILANTPTPPPTLTPVPTVTPTALPFAPAAEGETLIVVLPFHSTAANNSEAHKKIWRRIRDLLAETLPNAAVRTEIDPNAVLSADQQGEAEAVGKRYNASMVIWGEDTGVELIASFLNLREPDFDAADVDIDETVRTQMANPGKYAEFVTRELPGQLAFLALFAVGQTHYIAEDYPAAIDSIEAALAQVPTSGDQAAGDPEATVIQGLAEAYFRLGWLHEQAPASLDAAIAAYDKAIALDPHDGDAYNNRGIVYTQKDDYPRALADYAQAILLEPKDPAAYVNRGHVHTLQGHLQAAIADFDKALTLDPQSVEAFAGRGAAYYSIGDLDRAIADLDRAIELNPQYAGAYLNRAIAYGAKGEYDLSFADYDKAIELDPKFADAYFNRAIAYGNQGEYDRAIADNDKAIELNPQVADAYVDRAFAYAAKGEYDRAIADYDKAIELNPQDAAVFNNRAATYIDKGELDRAIADYDKSIELDPTNADIYVSRGYVYAGKGEYDRAIADYGKAIELNPQDTWAYVNRGIAYAGKGEYDRAIADYDKAIELNPQDTLAYASRGQTYAGKGEYERAIADYDKAIELTPQDASVYVDRGDAYAGKGAYDRAIADYDKAIKLDPQDADANSALCWWLALQQAPQKALAYCETAVSLSDDPAIVDSRGLAHALLGDFPAAIADFQVYVDGLAKNDPQNTEEIEQRRAWIEALQHGRSPFTPAVLEKLKQQ